MSGIPVLPAPRDRRKGAYLQRRPLKGWTGPPSSSSTGYGPRPSGFRARRGLRHGVARRRVAADAIGYRQQSAVGGQLDFVKGAQWSEGGKSIIVLSSSFMKNGERKSKISLQFAPGTPVTTPRSEVQYVATEYGCVNLKILNMSDRVRALISLAHPDFRDQLTQEAKDCGLI